jgi:hypothetical protein
MFSLVNLARYRKAITAGAGVLATALSLGLIHGTAYTVVQAIISVATAAGVYAIPNRAAAIPARPTLAL